MALPWQQGEARGTLNLPAATKVEDLKLCLNASDCAAVMFDTVVIEVRKGGSVLKRKKNRYSYLLAPLRDWRQSHPSIRPGGVPPAPACPACAG